MRRFASWMMALHPLRRRELVRVVELAEGGRGNARGDLTRLGAAHPVGDGEERRLEDEGVLVAAPLAAGIASCRRCPSASSLEPQLGVADLHEVALAGAGAGR